MRDPAEQVRTNKPSAPQGAKRRKYGAATIVLAILLVLSIVTALSTRGLKPVRK